MSDDLFETVSMRGEELLREYHSPTRKLRLSWAFEGDKPYPFFTKMLRSAWVNESPMTRRKSTTEDWYIVKKTTQALDLRKLPEHLL